ncbi:MAG: tetratricopeptide repeat protein [bacterium JZ-2024 1]
MEKVSSEGEVIYTFVFTDIVESTRLWETNPSAMSRALERHDELIRRAVETHGGKIVKQVGDGFHAVFANASNAICCAIEAQRTIFQESWETPEPIRVRVAVHSGEAQFREHDYYGPTLNRCHRLMSVAHGGQILVSSVTRELVSNYLPPGVSLKSLGEHRLPDLVLPEVVYQVVHPDLPQNFPPIRTLGTYQHNLPIQTTNFVGRANELREATRLLKKCRLVTLVGAGGVGKTRLALQIGADLIDRFRDGVWFIELAHLSDPSFVAQAVAVTLSVREEPGRSLADTLIDYLRPKHILLILDNCEHLVDAVATLADALLAHCPDLRILATSREDLRVSGEHAWRLPSLSAPDSSLSSLPGTLAAFESVQLFIDRAKAVVPGFALTPENANAVARICDLLDGIPLALELAAGRLASLSVQQVADRLSDRFVFLTYGKRTSPSRHKTLAATIEWSYDLLSNLEKRLFERLSVFAGGSDLDAVESICAAHPIPKSEILDLLSFLTSKSLVNVQPGLVGPEVRYSLLKTLSAYAQMKLVERGEKQMMQRNHLQYYLALVETAEPDLTGPNQDSALQRLEMEHQNILSALRFCLEEEAELDKGLRLATAIWRYWIIRGVPTEGRRLLLEILERAQGKELPGSLLAKAYSAAGAISWAMGDYDESDRWHHLALDIRRSIGDTVGIASSLNNLALNASARGDTPIAIQSLQEAVQLIRSTGDISRLAHMLDNLGANYIQAANPDLARISIEEALRLYEQTGDLWGKSIALGNLALVFSAKGDLRKAFQHAAESLCIAHRLGHKRGILSALAMLAEWHQRLGSPQTSLCLCAFVTAANTEWGSLLSSATLSDLRSTTELVKKVLPDDRFQQIWQKGSELNLQEVISLALQRPDSQPTDSSTVVIE